MLQLHFANRFETLADQLVERLGVQVEGRSPFDADEVIVPSAAITRQLIVELARRHRVCANVRFSYLASWLWEQSAKLMPELGTASPFEADVLAWRILAAFEDAPWATAQPRLSAWLERSDAVTRHELAVRVAALFEQYLTYRPDWLERWAAGEHVALGAESEAAAADQQWQAALWRRLDAETGGDGLRTALTLLKMIAQRGIGLAGTGALAASAHVFCLPAMPPAHLELLQRLGLHVDLHLYVLNPSREFWFDVVEQRRLAWLALRGERQHHEEGNRLLAAWGQQTRSQLGLLVDAPETALAEDARFTPAESGTLLGALQDAILDLRDLAPGSLEHAADDRSVEVHVCHSLTRELEVLHDRLLGLFAQAQPPKPGEILVVTPDLDAAAPLIDAVFGTAPAARHLPYTITGRSRADINAPARALLELLALAGSRFPVSEVFGLLQQPAVARRFGLAQDELDQVRKWLVQSGVHWALDASHRESFELPAQSRHSFSDGLDRLFLGYALPTHLREPFDGRLPAGHAEGSGAQTLGAFWRFVDALKAWRDRVRLPRLPADWPALLADGLSTFVQPDDTELEDLRDVNQVIEELADHWRRSGLAQALSLDVVRSAVERALDDPARGGVPTGMITFAAMSSLRNVPFGVVCAIGLNDGAFPTPARPAEFDLMTHASRRGDRQRRIDERNVFLDLLLAARDRVHLSYTGRSVRDNSVLPPSVLLSELLEYLVPAIAPTPADGASRARARARLVVEHPLQAFAERTFEVAGDPRVRSFRSDYADALKRSLSRAADSTPSSSVGAARDGVPRVGIAPDDGGDDSGAELATPFFATPLSAPGDEWRDVPVATLAAFFRNPCRFLLEKRLGIALRRDEDELQDDEPFLADVGGYGPLVQLLLPALLEGLPVDAARTLALAGTGVPIGGFGAHMLERELEGLRHFADHVLEHTVQPVLPPHAASVTLDIDGQAWRVHAGFADLRPRGLLRYRYGNRGAADYLAAWLPHLLLCATTPRGVESVTTTGVGRDGRFFLTECEAPEPVLRTLLQLYARGLREPLAFFPRSAWAYLDSEGNVAKAAAAFRPGGFALFPEGDDAGYRLALRGRPDPFTAPVVDEFIACARAVFEPLRACLELE